MHKKAKKITPNFLTFQDVSSQKYGESDIEIKTPENSNNLFKMNQFTPIVVPTFSIRLTIFYFPAISVVLMTSNIFKFGREIAKRSKKVQTIRKLEV